MHGERAITPVVNALDQLVLRPSSVGDAGQAERWLTEAAQAGPLGNATLDFVRRSSQAACAISRKMATIAKRQDVDRAEYPPFQLAGQLRTIAQLIRADQGIRIYFTEHSSGDIGGYDNHAGQRDNHAALLEQLSESVGAFAADLARDKVLDRVLLMTFSEFGRTLAENGRRGTDHGSAAPVFLVGGRLKGGLVGPHPSLTELENNGPKHHTDFRRVYATVLDRWLGWDSRAALARRSSRWTCCASERAKTPTRNRRL